MNVGSTASSENIWMKLNKPAEFICRLKLYSPVTALQVAHYHSDLSFRISQGLQVLLGKIVPLALLRCLYGLGW
jgi:hypothetical protein